METMITKEYFPLVSEIKETKERKEAEELLFSEDWTLITTAKNNDETIYVLGKLK